MTVFTFTKYAEKSFLKLSKKDQDRIREKLRELKTHPDILATLRRLRDFEPATHRLRIGNFRAILEMTSQKGKTFTFTILDIGNRREIYR